MGFRLKVQGLERVERVMNQFGDKAEEVMDVELRKTAQDTRNKAVQSIQRGPKSGRTYQRGAVTHQASAPGQPPATDTGNLVSSITFDRVTGLRPAYEVGTDEAYGAALEFGTTRLAERPWLRPAVSDAVDGLAKRVAKRIEGIRINAR